MTPDRIVGSVLVFWVLVNLVLFSALFVYGWRLRQRWKTTSVGYVAIAFVLVAGTLVLSSIQRLGIHAARIELIPADWEEFFLVDYQVLLSLVGTIAGVYALTRLRSGMRRMVESERVVGVLTDSPRFDVNVADWDLTPRELEVLETIVSGQTSDSEIAAALFISTATAATHVRNILKKAGMSRRMDLMLVGHRESVADADPQNP